MSKRIQSAMDIARRMAGGRVGFAEGGVPGADLRRQRQNAAMAGRELTPEQEAAVLDYIANLDARKEAVGQQWDKATEGMFMPSPALPQMDPKTQREISNRSLAGRDLNYGQMRALADNAAAKETRSNNLGTVGALGAEITGVPSMLRGAENISRGIEARDPVRMGGGALEAAIGAVPGLSVGRGIASRVADAAMSTPMRRAGLFGAAGGLTSFSDEATAGQRNAATFIENHPEIKSLNEKRAAAFAAMQEAEMKLIEGNPAIQALEAKKADVNKRMKAENLRHARSGSETQKGALEEFRNEIKDIQGQIDGIRTRALQPYQDELARINKAREIAEEDARAQFKDQAGFRENYPGAGKAILGGGLALAGGMPLFKEVANRAIDRFSRGPAIERAMETAKRSLENPAIPASQAAAEQTILRNKLANWDRNHGAIHNTGSVLGAMGKGAVIGTEASQVPEQIDYFTNEPGHPAREKAAELFGKASYWNERMVPAISGAGAGLFGATAPALLPKNHDFLVAAREVANRGRPPSAMQTIMSYMPGPFGKAALGPTERAMKDVERYRSAAGVKPAPEPASSGNVSTAPGPSGPSTPPQGASAQANTNPLGSSFQPHPAMGPAHAIEDALPAFGQKTAQGPSPTSAAPANSHPLDNLDIPVLRAGSSGKTKHGKGGKFSSPEAERKRLIEEIKKLTDGTEKKNGGVVASAMRIARAMGGRVHTGPILQRADGGRTDTVPMDVPAGSYVIPADIISALGEGDTSAGMKAVDGMFGPHAEGSGKDPVPIIAAGGEYVLSPTQVARIAGGDLSRAHAMLDQWVKSTRAKHIETLANLPGPER